MALEVIGAVVAPANRSPDMPRPAPRTLADVKACLERDRKRGVDERMARLMLKHGNLTDEAVLWIGDNYPSVWEE
jgi:hypothetical protein